MFAPQDTLTPIPGGSPRGGRSPTPRRTILILDPDRATRDFLVPILAAVHIDVLEAATPDEARTHMPRRPFAAFVEVNLPLTPGDVIAEELARARIYTVLMSASEYGVARARRSRFPLLRKPLALHDALRHVVLGLPASV
jgi:DNA-binding NtrC family response regulator